MPDADPYDENALLEAVRAGDQHAQGVLFAEHRGAALAFARSLSRDGSAEDLVSDSFQRVFEAMKAGGGPQKSFRQYLLTTVRRVHIDAVRSVSRRELAVGGSEEIQLYGDKPMVLDAGAESFAEGDLVRRAFATLPERWRVVLWRTAVEGKTLQDVADELGMKPNAVAQLTFRAREGLRTGYLGEHAADAAQPECRAIATDLARWVRGGLSPKRSAQIEAHVEGCLGCTAAVDQLSKMNSDLGAVLLVSIPLASAPLAGQVAGQVAGQDGWTRARQLRRGLVAAAVLAAVGLGAWLLRSGDDAAPVSSEPVVPLPGLTLTPSPSPRPSATPSATPTPTPSPSASPTLAPAATPTPLARPSALLAPQPRTVPNVDVRVVAASSGPVPGADPSWHHVAFSVRAPAGTALRLTLSLSGTSGVEVHHDLPFGRWYCTPTVPGNGTSACTLARTSTSRDFALDVRTASSAGVSINVQPVDARDTAPGNNARAITVS
ncbi:MAG: sigma-70 family RNA polymerase sigma factor [Nocardioidaceae bacterium]|nr:sigma-70 family RNA polymerase sigma factor [Nocardioidaceae bacterium]